MTETFNPTPEQVVRTEVEHRTPIVVLYRGSNQEGKPTNPFMSAVAQGLAQRGLSVIDRPIDPEVVDGAGDLMKKVQCAEWAKEILNNPDEFEKWLKRNSYKENDDWMSKLRKQYGDWDDPTLKPDVMAKFGNIDEGSIVLTDFTLQDVGRFLDKDSFSPYYELSGLEGKTSVIEAIRKDGKQPVILPASLNDHTSYEFSEDEKDALFDKNREFRRLSYSDENDNITYALKLKEELNVPVLLVSMSHNWGTSLKIENGDDIPGALQHDSIDPEKTVLLVDHHLYNLSTEQIHDYGLDKVEITPICPCCTVFEETYVSQLEKLGFRMYPIKDRLAGQKDSLKPILDSLVSQIQQREATK